MGPIGGMPQYKKDKIKFLMEVVNNDQYSDVIRQTARGALDGLGVDCEVYESGRKMVDETYRRYYDQQDEMEQFQGDRIRSRMKRVGIIMIGSFLLVSILTYMLFNIIPDPDKTTTRLQQDYNKIL